MSMHNPDLVGPETFGIAANWGTFGSAYGLSVSAMGVFGHDVFAEGDRLAFSGGMGIGLAYGSGQTVGGAHIGIQWTR